MASEPAQDNLLKLLEQISLGDLSMLELALQQPHEMTPLGEPVIRQLFTEFVRRRSRATD